MVSTLPAPYAHAGAYPYAYAAGAYPYAHAGAYAYGAYPYAYGYPQALVAHANGAVVPADEPAVVAAKADHFAAHGFPYAAGVYAGLPYAGLTYAGLVAHPKALLSLLSLLTLLPPVPSTSKPMLRPKRTK